MKEFLEILKYILPSLVVFATAFYLIRTFLDHELKQSNEVKMDENRKASLPLRFQAYERIILFLERINPANMVLRVNKAGLSKEVFQTELLQTVREEYEHNLAQQIYMSDKAWEMVKSAKEEVLSDINTAAAKMTEKNTAADYGQQVISLHLEKKNPAHDAALKFLKDEIREMF
ncbi:MAG: hypothetical protein RQ761_10775 [Bacteroidales bacterium]|nr:hypothetical protein [Bacteroidales bacterium]